MSRVNKKPKPVCLDSNMPICKDFGQIIEYQMFNDEDIKNVIFSECEANSQDFCNYSFENIIFRNCSFTQVALSRCSFTNVLFEHCNFPNCDFSDSWFEQVLFVNTNLKGANFTKSRILNARLEQCNARYANFTSCRIETAEIENCDASDSFFAECSFKHLAVVTSKFLGTEFFHSPLKGIDFSTCDFRGICVSKECRELQGVIVNIYQAAELSKMLGVIIKEEE